MLKPCQALCMRASKSYYLVRKCDVIIPSTIPLKFHLKINKLTFELLTAVILDLFRLQIYRVYIKIYFCTWWRIFPFLIPICIIDTSNFVFIVLSLKRPTREVPIKELYCIGISCRYEHCLDLCFSFNMTIKWRQTTGIVP